MNLDDPARHAELRPLIQKKASLNRYYLEVYRKYRECLTRCPKEGLILELGSGCGFVKSVIPEAVTSDVIPYPGIDQVIDATKMDLPDASVRLICMWNVLHHIPDPEAFFREANRCLVPGGRVFIVDQYAGWLSSPIYKHFHHEPFDDTTKEWRFASSGPLSGANGALAGIFFAAIEKRLKNFFPDLWWRPTAPTRPYATGSLVA